MDRRNFIRSTCTYCAGAIGLGIVASQLSSCSNLPIYKTTPEQGTMKVPLSSFNGSKTLILRNAGSEEDILLVKRSETDINALQMICTHRDQPLTAKKDGLVCFAHGSRFDLEGNVTQQPASRPLKRYKTEVSGNIVTVDLK